MANFATWLFGLAAEAPGEYRRLQRIRQQVYTTIAPLEAEVVRSAEPIAFVDLDRAAFRPFRAGSSWGGVGACAWLRITGEVPRARTATGAGTGAGTAATIATGSGGDMRDPVVMLGIRGEGLVYSADGDVIDSVSTVFQQGDLPHSGGAYRPVTHVDTTTGRVEFYVDVAYNGFILYEVGRGLYRGAHLAVRNDEAHALYYDYLTLLVLARSTTDRALAAELRTALDLGFGRFASRDIRGARLALEPHLAAESQSDFTYSAIGHGHLDMAWLWPLRETRRKAARTYTRAVNTIAEHDGYLYGTSQPQQLWWMKQEQPALFGRVKQAVAEGRIELQGSFWVEPDTNLPSGESLVRQALVGRRFLQQEFGLTDAELRLCWLPDTFGYNGNLPQILKKSGMDWFQTIKLSWNKVTVFPHRSFHWEGIDGSSVLVHMPPEGDYNSRGAADGLLKGLAQYPERMLGTALLVFGSGDGGGGPGEVHLEVTGREKNLRGLPRVVYETAGDFFRRLETLDITHTHSGELYLETHQGTYTTQGQIKRHNRLIERRLHEAEALAVMVGESSTDALESTWREVLLNQFHDILPGSSIARVNREAVETYERLEEYLDGYIGGLLRRLAGGGGSGGAAAAASVVSALNLTSVARREHVKTRGRWYTVDVGPYASAALEPSPGHPELVFTDDTLSNGILTLRFGTSGEIVSCVDADGAEHAADGLNRLVLHRDPYQFPFAAWDIGQKYTDRTPRTLSPVDTRTSIDGPRLIRTQVYRWAKGDIVQRVVLEAGSDLVRFETHVDWRERHRMLRADFRPSRYGDVVKCEIQFGHIERTTLERSAVEKAQFEVCAHKWIATENAGGGFALLNDGKYGHRAKGGLISLNLLRATTFPDKTADRGSHDFTYAFRPFATGDLTGVVRDGYRLNNPVTVAPGLDVRSIASSSDPAVIIETIKPAESGSGVIVRLYESLGRATTTALTVDVPYRRAVETDLMENPIGEIDLQRIPLGPFEITTVLLEA